MAEDKLFLQKIALVCFCSNLKGAFILNNFTVTEEISILIDILKELGQDIIYKDNTLTINSNGALHLFKPKSHIDIKGSKVILFAMCGMLAPYDYNVVFIDSTSKLKKDNFHSIVLSLYELGIRFKYGENFTLPIQMEGSSNFLPTSHQLVKPDSLLSLTLINLGLQGFGVTKIKHTNNLNNFDSILKVLNANAKFKEGEISICLHLQNFKQVIELDIKNI